MDENKKNRPSLLDAITIELDAIIDDNEAPSISISDGSKTKGGQKTPIIKMGSQKSLKLKITPNISSKSKMIIETITAEQIDDTPTDIESEADSTDAQQSIRLLHNSGTTCDEDLRKMQQDLTQSYELFQQISEKLENINFSCLKTRIKDLHLTGLHTKVHKDLMEIVERRYSENSLLSMTDEVINKFRNHPGEFGDIPELSQFFKTCAQLKHGLENLKKQRSEYSNLEKRVYTATEMSYTRAEQLQQEANKGAEKH